VPSLLTVGTRVHGNGSTVEPVVGTALVTSLILRHTLRTRSPSLTESPLLGVHRVWSRVALFVTILSAAFSGQDHTLLLTEERGTLLLNTFHGFAAFEAVFFAPVALFSVLRVRSPWALAAHLVVVWSGSTLALIHALLGTWDHEHVLVSG